MSELVGFAPWPKIPRLRRDIVITEKIDGTNACVVIRPVAPDEVVAGYERRVGDHALFCQSRNRLIEPGQDNAGFAAWAHGNADVLVEGLGVGRHYGEWWGQGIQRGYDLDRKAFSLFNAQRWGHGLEGQNAITADARAIGVSVVPVIASGPFDSVTIDNALNVLIEGGSIAAPGYMRPEGVVVFHTQSHSMFKVLIEGDDVPKSAALKDCA